MNLTLRRAVAVRRMDRAYRDMLDTAGKSETDEFDRAAARFSAARQLSDRLKEMGA